ncbi:hypothetical protein [Staphylococcus capitis]|uniref:hypothetical protein n=1 Tax=Staphylococcus capitis TaxID=29388 RepID=UPI000B292002|nr:hypothetical protein [Staphylococcus capitis]
MESEYKFNFDNSNGRWVRNFVQELLVVHKNEVINSNEINIDLTMISDQTILKM